MRLSVVFELLLVFLFLAFAAARVIDPKTTKSNKNVAKGNKKTTVLRQGPPNRYCACTSRMCNCCRDFSLPVVPIKGPGCASIMYVQKDTMMVTMSFGDRVLSNTTISGKTPKPICMALPGGISQFCGRIYGISRKGDQFRACLGLELRALDDIEAALRVSCFKFGPKGVRLESAPPVPVEPVETGGKDPDEDDDDDYDDLDDDDDLIGFGVDDEDDGASSEDNEVESDSVDYTGFSVLGEDLLGTLFSDDSGSSSAKKKKPTKKTAKPQVIVQKASTTTRRPLLPNRRRTTVRPVLAPSRRPILNRITKRPSSTTRPQIVKRPTTTTVVTSPPIVHTTFSPVILSTVTKNDPNKYSVIKTSVTTTEAPSTTTEINTTPHVMESEKVQLSEQTLSQGTTSVQTEEPITFTIPTQKVEVVKNDIKIPQIDLAKVEAVAAIAQMDVPSGVISSTSLTSEETQKPVQMVTVKYEKITPVPTQETTPIYTTEYTEKISSVKYVPTTVVTSRPSAEVISEDESLDETIGSEIATNSGIKNKITTQQQIVNVIASDVENKKTSQVTTESPVQEIIVNNNNKKNTLNKKGNNQKKQNVKKPVKEEDEEEEEEEEEEEDLLEGVLSDDDSDNSDAEETEGSDESQTLVNENKVQNTSNEEEAEDDDDDDEDDILGETIETDTKTKPTKVSIKKKKPASDESANEEDEEEEEEEEDILEVLGDDVGDDDEEEEVEEDDEDEGEKNKKKPTTVQPTTIKVKKPTTTQTTIKNKKPAPTQATTIKIKQPTTQKVVQTRKPVTTTEKIIISPATEEDKTEKPPEKIFIYQEPNEKVTEKVIIYQEPENKIPSTVFIYKEPENKVTEKTTENVIFYQEPIKQTVPEKFIIYKEPDQKITKKPVITVVKEHSSEEIKESSEEKIDSNEDSSSEEDDDDSHKHTVVASIDGPGFSNKYAEQHDLTENDDLEIEDSEDEDIDFEEDRKMKQSHKKPIAKPLATKKTEISVNKPKVLSLTDLIGPRKKYPDTSKNDRIVSSSRTHRRMNLDRFLVV